MALTSVDDSGTFPTADADRQLDIPWDDPYPYYTSMIPSEPPDDDPLHCVDEDNTTDAAPPRLSELKPGQFTVRPVF